jgi:hypothetical protein
MVKETKEDDGMGVWGIGSIAGGTIDGHWGQWDQ